MNQATTVGTTTLVCGGATAAMLAILPGDEANAAAISAVAAGAGSLLSLALLRGGEQLLVTLVAWLGTGVLAAAGVAWLASGLITPEGTDATTAAVGGTTLLMLALAGGVPVAMTETDRLRRSRRAR